MKSSQQIDEGSGLFDAKKRLHILINGDSKDIYSAETQYYRSCYSHFIYESNRKNELQDKMH